MGGKRSQPEGVFRSGHRDPGGAAEILDDAWHQFSQKYSIGANWYPLRGLNFSGQYYYKLDDNHYDNTVPVITPASGYPGFIQQENFEVNDVNFRATWRPCAAIVAGEPL